MRTLRGLAALLTLLALIIGIPAALIALGGNPLTTLLDGDMWQRWITTPDTDTLIMPIITVAGWIAWASFAVSIIAAIPARVRGTPPVKIPGLAVQQRAAGALIGAVALMLAAPLTATAATGADTPAPATTAVASASIQAPQEVTPPAEQNDEAAAADETTTTASTTTYTVTERGDSLWNIAQTQLGDGNRWPEIADLNYGRTQPDGRSLSPDDHWLDLGWELVIPAEESAAADPAAAAETTTEYTVQTGDTLSAIADDQLGDPALWPELAEATSDLKQPDGAHLTDPDLIRPGWTILIPTTSEEAPQQLQDVEPEAQQEPVVDEPEQPAAEEPEPAATAEQQPAEEADVSGEQAADPAAVVPEPATAPVAPATDDATDQQQEETAVDVRTIAGGGALLAAGVISLLAYRRSRSQRRRPPGQRIALPEPSSAAAQTEQSLRATADVDGQVLVDHALRELGLWCQQQQQPLPKLRAARYTPDHTLTLYLAQPSTLPQQWSDDGGAVIWSQQLDDLNLDLDLTTALAPYPSLVTVGRDTDEDGDLLLDLEHLDDLAISGTLDDAHATMAALAIELATAAWADTLQITLIGILPELADAIETGRVRHAARLEDVLIELESRAASVAGILTEHAAESPAEARGRGIAEDTWAPEILLVGTQLDDDQRTRLDQVVRHLPRVGIAAVTNTDAPTDWSIDLTATPAQLLPAGITITPSQVTPAAYAQILQVLTSGETEFVPGPSWAAHLADVDTEPALETIPAAAPNEDVESTSSTTAAEDEVVAATTAPEHPADDESAVPASIYELHEPILDVLGPVALTGPALGPIAPDRESQALEIITYLALHDGGVTHQQLSAALWPGKEPKASTRNSAVTRARNWLGSTHDGQARLPYVEDDGLYRLHAVTTTWHQLLAAIGDDITTTPLPTLVRAMRTIHGRPFAKERAGRYKVRAGRYTWAETHTQEIVSTCLDLTREVARRSLQRGDHVTAAEAATIGLLVDAYDEGVRRDAIRAAWAAGDDTQVAQLVEDLHTMLEELDADPTPETNDLLADLERARTHPPAQPTAI